MDCGSNTSASEQAGSTNAKKLALRLPARGQGHPQTQAWGNNPVPPRGRATPTQPLPVAKSGRFLGSARTFALVRDVLCKQHQSMTPASLTVPPSC